MITMFCILFSGCAAARWMTLVCDNGYNPDDDSYTPSVIVIYNNGDERWQRRLDEDLLKEILVFTSAIDPVGAIKHLRSAANMGLGEAKAVVDTLRHVDNCRVTTETKVVVTGIRFG